MTKSGTVEERFLSVTDADVRNICTKYPDEKYRFLSVASGLIETRRMIEKGYSVLDALSMQTDTLLGRLTESAADQFLAVLYSIDDYNVASEPGAGSTNNHGYINQQAQRYLASVMTRGKWNTNNRDATENNTLDAYLLALHLEPSKPELTQKEIDAAVDAKKKTEEILEEAKRLLGPESIANYADFFSKSAQENSRRNIDQTKDPVKRIGWYFGFLRGGAQRFLIIASLLIIIGVLFAYFTHSDAPLFENNLPNAKAVSRLIERVLGLLLIAYLIRFALKQYSIRMHLYTVNRHRANILNSFKLLFQSVGKESPAVRDELTLLVAAGVYNIGDTGYLNDKTIDDHILPLPQLADKLLDKVKNKP
jgi:hypothetical protein